MVNAQNAVNGQSLINAMLNPEGGFGVENNGQQSEGGDGKVRVISLSSAFRFCSVFLSSDSFIAVDTERRGGAPYVCFCGGRGWSRLWCRWAAPMNVAAEGPRR
jgi:hypothetical protein